MIETFHGLAASQPRSVLRAPPTGNLHKDVYLTMKVFNRLKSPRSPSSAKGSAKDEKKAGKDSKSWKKVVDTDEEEENSHHLSDLSNSTDAEDIENIESLDDNSEDCERFERQLRHKHAKACKAMSVGGDGSVGGCVQVCRSEDVTNACLLPYIRMDHTRQHWHSSSLFCQIFLGATASDMIGSELPCTM